MAVYVYEFLWRGRANGDAAYHVILAEEQTVFGKTTHVESGVLTPEQAEAQGFSLETIIANINASALKARDAALAEKAEIENERNELANSNGQLASEVQQLSTELRQVVAERDELARALRPGAENGSD